MKRILTAVVLAAPLLHAAEPAGTAHGSHHAPGASERAATAPKEPVAPKPIAAATPRAGPGRADGYRSPFADYRAFDRDVAAKGWRDANDEVREAGGQAGVMSHGKAKEEAR